MKKLWAHNVAIKHAIYQNDAVAQAYIGEIQDKSVSVQDVNAPVAADNTVQTSKNTTYTFKTADFLYSDADGDPMTKVQIVKTGSKYEAAGDLEYNTAGTTWVDISDSLNEITVANIGKLRFIPDTDAGGSGYGNFKFKVHDGLSYSANSATMKVNVGDSVQTTIKYFKQSGSADQLIKSTTIIVKDEAGTNDLYTGAYKTNTSGVVDFTGVTDAYYNMSFSVANAVAKSAINIQDVAEVLDISSGLNKSPTQNQKVAADFNQDGTINIQDVADVLDISSGLNKSAVTGVFRDKATPYDGKDSSNKSHSLIKIEAGNNMNFDAYILGDVNGSYADILAGG